jgi:hypothetical protein
VGVGQGREPCVSAIPHRYRWLRSWEPGFSYGWGIPPYTEDVLAYTA